MVARELDARRLTFIDKMGTAILALSVQDIRVALPRN